MVGNRTVAAVSGGQKARLAVLQGRREESRGQEPVEREGLACGPEGGGLHSRRRAWSMGDEDAARGGRGSSVGVGVDTGG